MQPPSVTDALPPSTALPLQATGHLLQQAVDRLSALVPPQAIAARLAQAAPAVRAELGQTVLAQIPAYRESRNPEVLPQLASHGAAHVDEIVRLLAEGRAGDLAFVHHHATLRAGQYFPLEAVLHAYRCGHKVFARRLLELASDLPPPALTALADVTLEYTDAISTLASAAYVEQARRLTAAAVDEQAALLDLLLAGHDESDRRATSSLRKAGFLDGRQAFCVVLAHSMDPAHMLDAARARRLADALDALVPVSLARRLIDVRSGTVTMVLAGLRRVSGWTAPLPTLSARVGECLSRAGNDVLVGLSPDVEATAHVPAAHRKAALALQLAHPGRRVCAFDGIALRTLMLHQAAPALRDLLPAWHGALVQADERSAGSLQASLRAYADADLNLLKTAARLQAHPNTVYARFERVRQITGLDPRRLRDLETLLLALDLETRPRA
ncbi:MAG: helix-turn-helix domain-containing protein [Rhodoferax sp.]